MRRKRIKTRLLSHGFFLLSLKRDEIKSIFFPSFSVFWSVSEGEGDVKKEALESPVMGPGVGVRVPGIWIFMVVNSPDWGDN